MRRINMFIIATAMILTAGVGGWTVLTTYDVKAAAKPTNNYDFPARPPVRGGLFVLPVVY
jgi:hypothetical protein